MGGELRARVPHMHANELALRLGVKWTWRERWSVLASGGRTLRAMPVHDRADFAYLGVQLRSAPARADDAALVSAAVLAKPLPTAPRPQ